MFDGGVALCAFDVAVGDVHSMQECDVLELTDPLGLVVTIETARLVHEPGSLRHVVVTVCA